MLTQTAWASGDRDLGIVLDHGYRVAGAPRLVLERGYDDAVAGALESLEPEGQRSADALVDALETSVRVQRWALTLDTPRHRALAGIAADSAARAQGRFNALVKLDDASRGPGNGVTWALRARAGLLTSTGPAPADAKNPEAVYSFLALLATKSSSLWHAYRGWDGVDPGYKYQFLKPQGDADVKDYVSQGWDANDVKDYTKAYYDNFFAKTL